MKADYTGNRQQIVDYLAQRLQGEKFEHSLEVEKTAVDLARRWGADEGKAGLAGLLHDVTKQMDNRALAEKYGIPVLTEKTLHGFTAAAYLEENGVVDDEDVLNAIRYHTTGRPGMTLLEKNIFVADYIEPLRDFEGAELLRQVAQANLDHAVLLELSASICHVIEKKSLLDLQTVEAYNYYRLLIPKEEL